MLRGVEGRLEVGVGVLPLFLVVLLPPRHLYLRLEVLGKQVLVFYKLQLKLVVNGRYLVEFLVVVVDDEVLDGTLEDGLGKFQNLILSLKIEDGMGAGPEGLLVLLQDGILDILDVGLVNKNDLTILECFKFLYQPIGTYISLLLSMKSYRYRV